ncbi:MAG: periplasmic heavy metal sensor [Pseudoxanthomonas sp.]
MKSKNIAIAAILAATLMGSAITVYSQPSPAGDMPEGMREMGGCQGGMPCPGMQGHGMMGRGAYTPEQQQKYDAIVAEFVKQMEPVKDQMFIKRQELRALQNASNPDIAAVRATATEMLQLRKQLGQMHETMTQRIEKEVGKPAAAMPKKDGSDPAKHQHGAAQ